MKTAAKWLEVLVNLVLRLIISNVSWHGFVVLVLLNPIQESAPSFVEMRNILNLIRVTINVSNMTLGIIHRVSSYNFPKN